MTNPSYVRRDPTAIFEAVLEHYGPPHFPRSRNPAGVLNEPFWAGLYRNEHNILFEPRENQFYEYTGDIYRPITSHLILDRLAERLRQVAKDYPKYAALVELTDNRYLSGAIAHLKGQTQKEEAFDSEDTLIHVANGVLNLNGGNIDLRPFSPDLISRNLIPIPYDLRAKCPRFKTEILGLLEKEDQEVLQKFLGLFLLGRNIIQKFLVLHGLGETGKSTFTEIARRLIGEKNCSELRTNLLHERFEIGSYIGKKLLFGADVPRTFLNSKGAFRIKALVGGDLLDAERKGSNYRFQLPGYFNIVITSNTRLTFHLENDRAAWGRRLVIIEYERPRTSQTIPEFAHLLITSEGPGILNYAAEGLLMLRSDIETCGTVSLSVKQKKRIEDLLNESDGLRLFLNEKLEEAPGCDLSTDEIISTYAQYSTARGWNMNTRQTELSLKDHMVEQFGVLKSNDIKRGSSNNQTNVRGYHGVTFK
jgi:P4 family phage/plasmid primase-like protien